MEYQKKLQTYIERTISGEASDLHLSVNNQPNIRSDGELIPLSKEKELTAKDTRGFMEALLTKEQQKKFLKHKEIDFSYSYEKEARFRSNCYFQQGAIAIAMRHIPHTIRSLEELNLPAELERFTQLKQGFFLAVGPVGMGKTTTLATLIDLINSSRSEHIITIEDPIEYLHTQKQSVVEQREVGIDTKNFHTGLRSVFRQDVDVVMVGEMRDAETISTAVTAAETGHLVFSTLHTNDAAQTIDRIIDSFPAAQQDQIRVQLAGSLSGVFSQRLIPRVSGGRIPAYELLINNHAVGNLIREGRTHEINSVIETNLDAGMVSMNRSLAQLVRAGEIRLEDARRFSLQPQMLEKLI